MGSRSLVSKAAQLPTIANVERGRQPQVNGGQNGGKHALLGLPELGGNASAESGSVVSVHTTSTVSPTSTLDSALSRGSHPWKF